MGLDHQSLADSLSGPSASGAESLDRTVALVRDSRTVLNTQSEQSSTIADFSADLDSLADRLRTSDPDVRQLIDNGNSASSQLGQLVSEIGPGTTANLTTLSATAKAISLQATALQTLFVYLPGVAAASSTIAPDDGTVHLGLVAESNNPRHAPSVTRAPRRSSPRRTRTDWTSTRLRISSPRSSG